MWHKKWVWRKEVSPEIYSLKSVLDLSNSFQSDQSLCEADESGREDSKK